MSNTRRATDGSYHQSRYASSPEFNAGLAANLVAKRLSVIGDPIIRELIWFVQYLSHQAGGLQTLAGEIIAKYPEKIRTTEMAAMKLQCVQSCNAEQTRRIRADLPLGDSHQFELKGDISADEFLHDISNPTVKYQGRKECREAYPAKAFLEICRGAASSADGLQKYLADFCLDPGAPIDCGPWYFYELVEVLRDLRRQWAIAKTARVVTAVGEIVQEAIEYTEATGGLTLLKGNANLGSKFAARNLCEQNPGRYRFVEVPPTNDEASFFRAIGRALGGNWLNYKNNQITERIEPIVRSGDFTLVLWAAQNLWPQKNLREAFPGRLAWLISQTENGARVCLISGPQFFMQKRPCEKSAWDSPLFAESIGNTYELPDSLSVEDMAKVARENLPAASDDDCETIAIFAVGSQRYLASIEAVSKRAKYLADKAGRKEQTPDDIRQAMDFVNRSDSLLAAALAEHQEDGKRRRSTPARPATVTATPAPAPIRAAALRPAMAPGASVPTRGNIVAVQPH